MCLLPSLCDTIFSVMLHHYKYFHSFKDGVARTDAHFGPGGEDMPVHLGGLDCNGSEASILTCPRFSDVDCFHSEDASVVCVRGEICNN